MAHAVRVDKNPSPTVLQRADLKIGIQIHLRLRAGPLAGMNISVYESRKQTW